MTELTVKATINAPKSHVWNTLAAFDQVYLFNPYVLKSYSVNEQSTGLGAQRRCEFDPAGGDYIEEKILDWHEGEHYTLTIFGGTSTPPVHDLRVRLAVEAINAEETRACFTFYYTPKWGLLGTVADVIALRTVFKRLGKGTLKGLKHHVETGQAVDTMKSLSMATG